MCQAGKDVKANLKNWAKQQEAELAEDGGMEKNLKHSVFFFFFGGGVLLPFKINSHAY